MPGHDLERLLEAEERLAARLEEARAAAAGFLEAARTEATAVARRADEEERSGRARLETQVEAELVAELGRIEARADERVRTLVGVTGDRLRELSLLVLAALLDPPAREVRR
jgi:F0F1-type ATP synthase membrane subunit b/b'